MLSQNQLLIIRIEGDHKSAFTRLEQKVTEFTFTAIVTSTELFQSEDLLKTLQDRSSRIHNFDAEIELLLGNEDELAKGLEQQTEFHVSASVTIARLSALVANFKKERDRPFVMVQQTLLHQIPQHGVE